MKRKKGMNKERYTRKHILVNKQKKLKIGEAQRE